MKTLKSFMFGIALVSMLLYPALGFGEITGLRFSQIDFEQGGDSVYNSDWGSVQLDFESKPDFQYFNLVVNGDWQIQNIPIASLAEECVIESMTLNFNLGNLVGDDVVTIDYVASLTDNVLLSGPPGSATTVNVMDRAVTVGGLAGPVGLIPTATPLIGWLPIDWAFNKGIGNQDVGVDECVPGAFSNSLQWLNKENSLGIPANVISNNSLKNPTGWTAPATDTGGNPVPGTGGTGVDAWQGKRDALSPHGVSTKYLPASATNADSVIDEIEEGQDVELWGHHHAAVISGMVKHLDGTYTIYVTHDTQQGQNGGTVTEAITYDPATGQLQGGAPGFFGGYSIRGFVIECPAPEWWESPDVSVHWELTGPDSRAATEDTSAGYNAGDSTMDINDTPGPNDPWDHQYTLTVNNNEDPTKMKLMWMQYIYHKDGSGGIAAPTNSALHGSDQGTWSQTSYTETDLGNGDFKVIIKWEIVPQPASEWFKIWTLGNWYVKDVKVSTKCVPGPNTPPPDPHATVPGNQPSGTFLDFGVGSIPPIPADFFWPGSDPFVGHIPLEGVAFDPMQDDISTLVQRFGDPIFPHDLVGTTATIEIEIVALSLKSIQPITVIVSGQPQLWDLEITLSDVVPPPGQLTATKTHDNGGTFDSTFLVQPRFIFTSVSDNQVREFDTGLEGMPALQFSASNTPWVHSLGLSLDIIAPSDGTFVPGVEEIIPGDPNSQQTRMMLAVEQSGAARHTVIPATPASPEPPTTCAEVVARGYGIRADLDDNCYVNWGDFSVFAASWLRCNDPANPICEQTW